MTHKTATVTEARRYDKAEPYYEVTLDCAWPHTRRIHLDSPQWFAWLEAPENHAFSYALMNHAEGYIDGFMTVRKERRQRGGVYWSAYRRQGRRLRKIYLGPAASVTRLACVKSPLASTRAMTRAKYRRAHPVRPAVDHADAWLCAAPQPQLQLQLQLRLKGGKTRCRLNPNPVALGSQRHPSDASS